MGPNAKPAQRQALPHGKKGVPLFSNYVATLCKWVGTDLLTVMVYPHALVAYHKNTTSLASLLGIASASGHFEK